MGDVDDIQVIEFHMVDKKKYYPSVAVSGFFIRGIIYPSSLIKTRLQVQKHHAMYNGTYDAFRKIMRYEGFRGLYKGFWISNLFVFPQMLYISTYEGVRHLLANRTKLTDNRTRSFLAGACASIAGQTLVVPIDIVSQHLQVLATTTPKTSSAQVPRFSHVDPLPVSQEALKSRFGAAQAVVSAVYTKYGIMGFYRGYIASVAVYAPNSAMWWFFYDIYCNTLAGFAPVWVPRLALQCIAAPMGGISTSLLTNPMDAIRARIQLENTGIVETTKTLWKEEGFMIFAKGLTARLIQSITFSFFIILGYETVKRWTILDEYKHTVRW